MTANLNRRTFLLLIGASAAVVAVGRSSPVSAPSTARPPATPRCFMDGRTPLPPARPKTAAIQYLPE